VFALAYNVIFASFNRGQPFWFYFRGFLNTLVLGCSMTFSAVLVLRYLRWPMIANRLGTRLLHVVGILLGAIIGAVVGTFLAMVLGLVSYAHFWADYWQQLSSALEIGMAFILIIAWTLASYDGMRGKLEATALELRTRQMEEERAHKLLAEARLSSLESRIHPHFLFNTLNAIAALIPKDAKRAEQMVGELASLLRFSLNSRQAGLVPLAQELKVMRDYLEIEKARFGPRLRYTISIPADLENVGVPPLSLQSLVENSVKHVIAHRPEGGDILITAKATSDRICLEVKDDGPGFSLESIPAGHGVHNLLDRLTFLFDSRAHLEVAQEVTHGTVRISLPRSHPAKI
jgi:sensor histidine kinase YesM